MRVDSQISSMTMTRLQHSAGLRMEGAGKERGRSAVRNLDGPKQENALDVPSGSATRPSSGSLPFAEVVRSMSLPSLESQEAGVGLIKTSPAAAPPSAREEGMKEPSAMQGDGLIHTPFGTFDAASINARIVTEVIGSSPWDVYFMTHAPAEWNRSTVAREEFSKLYGTEALSVLDCHGTVPKNMDATWVTEPGYTLPSGRA